MHGNVTNDSKPGFYSQGLMCCMDNSDSPLHRRLQRSASICGTQASRLLEGLMSRHKLLCLVLLVFSGLTAWESNTSEDLATEHLNQGKLLLAKGDVSPSINEFQEALRLTPNSAVAHTQLAKALAAKGDIPGALTEYQRAVSLNPDSETFQQLGILLATSGNLEGGITAFRSALQLQPADARLHYNLGTALRDKGDVDGAIDEYRKVVLYKSTDYEARYQLGLALKEKGLREDALRELHVIIRETPDKPSNQKFLDLVRKSLATLE
jgi:Flp pilus assembly protein TadD